MEDATFQAGPATTPEELRQSSVALADGLLGARLVQLYLGTEGVRRLRAQREFWQNAGVDQVQALFDEYQKQP